MARDTVSGWSTTADDNVTVGTVNLGEYPGPNAMTPPDVNNAMRAMMAQIRTDRDLVTNRQNHTGPSNVPSLITANAYTPVLTDAEIKLVQLSDPTAVALTVPTNASVAYPVGQKLVFQQAGNGAVTVTGASGVTVNTTSDQSNVSAGPNAIFTLAKTATDTWTLFGGLLTPGTTGYRLGAVRTYTANATWTRPAGLKAVKVRVQAAGAGGGGTVDTTGSGNACAGGGGGGEYAEGFILVASLGSSEIVTPGTGGAGGAAGNNAGSVGGNASFGSLVTCTGGNGGTGSATSTGTLLNQGGTGGTGGTGGYMRVRGSAGGNGQVVTGVRLPNGFGGGAMLGAIVGQSTNAAGSAGQGYGGGGSGAISGGAIARAGGAGADGIVIVEEYY
jgi:hypothetical protein